MKKNLKSISVFIIILVIIGYAFIFAFAESIYHYNGYLYTYINNEKVSLCGVDEGKSEVIVPNAINGRAVVDIANRAFLNNTELCSLDFSETSKLERIGSFAFSGCSNLDGTVSIPESVTTMSSAAFQNCSSITSLNYNASCNNVPKQCFYGCSSLENVTLNERVTIIEDYAFAGCSELQYFELSSNIISIAESAFSNDSNLTLGVWYGTIGYDYAIEQNIPYILLDGVKLGDVDGDGYVNINDVTHIQRHLAELESLEGIYLHAADANQDGTVDISDATIIQMYLAEYEMEYPIGKVMTQ